MYENFEAFYFRLFNLKVYSIRVIVQSIKQDQNNYENKLERQKRGAEVDRLELKRENKLLYDTALLRLLLHFYFIEE